MSTDTVRVVVGVDFETVGDQALDEAIRYASRIETSEIHPVFVITDKAKKKLDVVDRHLEEAREALHKRVVERCEATGRRFDQDVVLHVRLGEPAAALHQVAVDVDADAIVVGTHGRRGLSKMLLGSVAEELVRSARVPVLVARPKQLEELPKSPAIEEASSSQDLHARRVMATEKLSVGKRSSRISGLV